MSSELDIERIRRETPACIDLIHFNNAGCSLQPLPVRDNVREFLDSEQSMGGYETALANKDGLQNLYQAAARLINCQPDEIAYCEGSTRAWQQFFYSLSLRAEDRIITTRLDYGSNMVGYIQVAKSRGVHIDFVRTDENGDLDLNDLENLITDRTRLISISHIPTGNGIVNPAVSIGEIAHQAGVPYLLDACQSAGQLDLDVVQIKCTALAAAGRKYLRGPRGSGFLFVRRDYFENAEPVFLEQQSVNLIDENNFEMLDSATRFENFETNLAGKLGLGVAMDYAVDLGMGEIEKRICSLGELCRDRLSDIDGVQVHDQGSRKCGIVTFSKAGLAPGEIRSGLGERGINIWISTGPGSLVDFQSRGIDSLARASVHYYNTEQEIELFCEALDSIN